MTAASCDERGQHPSRARCDLSGSTENRLLGYSARDNASRVLAMCKVHGKVSAACPVRGLPSGSRSRWMSEVGRPRPRRRLSPRRAESRQSVRDGAVGWFWTRGDARSRKQTQLDQQRSL